MLVQDIRNSLQEVGIKEEDSIIRGLWGVDCLFQPTMKERTFDCDFVVAQTVGQGCAYGTGQGFDRQILKGLVGRNYFDCEFDDIAIEIAIMDSLYEKYFKQDCALEILAKGISLEKLQMRSDIIYDETMRLCGGNKDIKVVNVGVVGNILQTFVKNGVYITGTDFDTDIIGKSIANQAEIYSGHETIQHVKEADVAIVTGMALSTNTIDDIIYTARCYDTKLVVFAETGAHLAAAYFKEGVDVFVSEPFPFYIFNGDSIFRVFRNI